MMKREILVLAGILVSLSIGSAAPVEIVSAELHGAVQPQVAVSPSGRIHITFGKENSIYHVSSADGGRSFSSAVKVGMLPKLALGMRRGPRVAATDDEVVITAISHQTGELQPWRSGDGGNEWKRGESINDVPGSAREGLHAMGGDGNGNLFVTWLDHRNKGTELWSSVSADGGVTWGANQLVYQSPDGSICQCCHPSVAMGANGEVVVMWRNWLGGARDMYLCSSNDGGKSFGPATKLGEGTWKLAGCPMDGGAVAVGNDGKPVTTWRRDRTVFSAATGVAEEPLANPASQSFVIAETMGPTFLWESGGGLVLQKMGALPRVFAKKASFIHGAAVPGGGAVVVWQSEAHGPRTVLAEVIDG